MSRLVPLAAAPFLLLCLCNDRAWAAKHAEQITVIVLPTTGRGISDDDLADVEVPQVIPFQNAYLEYMRAGHADLLARIASEKALSDDITAALTKATDDFKGGSQWASRRAA